MVSPRVAAGQVRLWPSEPRHPEVKDRNQGILEARAGGQRVKAHRATSTGRELTVKRTATPLAVAGLATVIRYQNPSPLPSLTT